MGFFDRFKSSKGKAASQKPRSATSSQPSGKSGKATADEAKQKAFANVPDGKPVESVKEKKKLDVPPAAAPVREATWEAYRLLLKPVVTEKTSAQAGQYAFEVPITASKVEIRNAVFHAYGVLPVSVNTVRQPGKVVRYGRTYGRTKDRKKAIVTLPAGKTIDVFST